MEIGSVLASVHQGRLSVQVAGHQQPIPDWADWLIWLGVWSRSQAAMEGRRVVVVRLPSRKLAAAFVSLGALLAASRIHDDSLDWDSLQALPSGTTVYWREVKGDKSTSYTGTVDSVREMGATKFLAISILTPKRHLGTMFLLPKLTALAYGVTLGLVTNRTDGQLTMAAELFKSLVDGAPHSWIRSHGADSTVVTETTSFLEDLSDLALVAGKSGAVGFEEALAISCGNNQQHGKLQLISSRSRVLQDEPAGVTVLDGANSAIFLGSARSRSIVLLLDYSEYDEETENLLSPFIGCSVDAGIHVPPKGVSSPPSGVNVFVFGLPGHIGESA